MSPLGTHQKTVIVSDAHVHPAFGNVEAFFDMLSDLENLPVDVIFLGDVFELWIAAPRYENEMQDSFLAWCRRNKKNRTVGFIEGNHEFFVHQTHGSCFSWSAEGAVALEDPGWWFVHGDQINFEDRQYLRFRKLTKNRITKWVVRWLPFGPRWVQHLNTGLKKTNRDYRRHFPRAIVEDYAARKFDVGYSRVFVGHFHTQFCVEKSPGHMMWVLPAWLERQSVVVIDRQDNGVNICHWQELARSLRLES